MTQPDGDLTAQAEETLAEQTPERPEWLPAEYASPEAVVDALKASKAKISEQGNELSAIREQMEEMTSLFAQQAPQQQNFDPAQHPLVRGMQQALDEGDALGFAVAMQQLIQAQAPQASPDQGGRELDPYLVQRMHGEIAAQYNADDALTAEAYRLMESHPAIAPQIQALSDNPNATIGDLAPLVDAAYQLAAYAGGVTQQSQSLAQKQAEEEAARQRKIEAETMTGSGPTRVASQTEQEKMWEGIKGADTGEFRVGLVG